MPTGSLTTPSLDIPLQAPRTIIRARNQMQAQDKTKTREQKTGTTTTATEAGRSTESTRRGPFLSLSSGLGLAADSLNHRGKVLKAEEKEEKARGEALRQVDDHRFPGEAVTTSRKTRVHSSSVPAVQPILFFQLFRITQETGSATTPKTTGLRTRQNHQDW